MARHPLIRVFAAVLLAAGLWALGGCGPSEERVEADRQAIEETLERYATQLSHAYAFTDPSALEEVAMPREVASVESNIAQMADEGRRIAADQKELTIENLEAPGTGTAFVNTLEVWDIRVMDLGSEREISRDENQESRVRYQLKTDGEGTWKVLWRQREGDEGTRVVGGDPAR